MSTTLSKRSTRQRRVEPLSYVALGHKLAAQARVQLCSRIHLLPASGCHRRRRRAA